MDAAKKDPGFTMAGNNSFVKKSNTRDFKVSSPVKNRKNYSDYRSSDKGSKLISQNSNSRAPKQTYVKKSTNGVHHIVGSDEESVESN